MVTIVVGFNVLLSLMLLYVAWKIRKLRSRLAKITKILLAAERNTYNVLRGAPKILSKGQLGANLLTERYQQLDPQLQRVQKILALFGLGQKLWLRNKPKSIGITQRFWRRS
ncbi:hypothetical protein [Coleofasciculus sp. FACHB-SPT36]|uniref:hypothetical protein n=1 Tax=Cyanophyceae TaxID=3028117 RepID=UPI00168BB88C|nr:hypothetical protein [Coleofasciculus sp. FACHB-SPT36]MBD2538581.1 hypothetical protein [Coleofasciculus sp. FACHB-SPT36]